MHSIDRRRSFFTRSSIHCPFSPHPAGLLADFNLSPRRLLCKDASAQLALTRPPSAGVGFGDDIYGAGSSWFVGHDARVSVFFWRWSLLRFESPASENMISCTSHSRSNSLGPRYTFESSAVHSPGHTFTPLQVQPLPATGIQIKRTLSTQCTIDETGCHTTTLSNPTGTSTSFTRLSTQTPSPVSNAALA